MGQDPLFWLAGAVRKLAKRVELIEAQRCLGEEMDENKFSERVEHLVQNKFRELGQQLMGDMVPAMQLVLRSEGLLKTTDLERFVQHGDFLDSRVTALEQQSNVELMRLLQHKCEELEMHIMELDTKSLKKRLTQLESCKKGKRVEDLHDKIVFLTHRTRKLEARLGEAIAEGDPSDKDVQLNVHDSQRHDPAQWHLARGLLSFSCDSSGVHVELGNARIYRFP